MKEWERAQRSTHDVPEILEDGLNIPNVVHMIFGLDPNFGHIKFGLTHYLAIMAARMHIDPQFIKWHYRYVPEGIWWECARPLLKMNRVEDIIHVHGKPRPMKVQHKADILRMRIMMEEGGIYLDSDVIALKSFRELRNFSLVMGQEDSNGLCNAVMLGRANTTFIQRWWNEYKHFDPEKQWAYHSVMLPKQLQSQYPDEVTVLSQSAFFTPLWTQLTVMYDKDDGYDYRHNFAVHLWTSADPNKRELLRHLSIPQIFSGKGSFQRVARQLLVDAHRKNQLCPYAAEQVKYLMMGGSNSTLITDDWEVKKDWKLD